MGNTESVAVKKRLARFRPDDRPVIEGVFDRLVGGGTGKSVTLEMLQASMGSVASDSMVRRVFRCVCSIDPASAAPAASDMTPQASTAPPPLGAGREQLLVFLADTLQGTAEERAPLVMAMSQHAPGPLTKHVTCQQVMEFVEDLVSAVVQVLIHRGRLQGWQPDGMGGVSSGVKQLAEQMCSELKASDGGCDSSSLEDWVFRVSQVSLYLEILVSEGLNVSLRGRPTPALLPPCTETPWPEVKCLLDLPTLMFLTPQLPDGYSAPWRLVFSTQLHGESFTRMLGGLMKMKRVSTLLLVRDTKGHVFGGFASQGWEVKPQFQGNSRCFLFTVFPRLRVYTATGYNQHFMYLNHSQQTMPNGLGMGGQHHYFGLWLDCDFGRGHSRARPKCTTYGSPQLSADEDFTLDSVEVWAVGNPPEPEEGEEGHGKRSILDGEPESKAIMELTGKTMHSEGLREPEED